jgi:light-regulated signal transduction histidine kinase (bacteriophytochrome)
METVEELHQEYAPQPAAQSVRVQSCAWLLELSLDWVVLRASENIHHLLGESHVTLIDEPLGRFVHAQALHDLRNLFSRLSGTTGIARAYAVRLTDEPELVDIAFQLESGRVILEAVPSAGSFGECFGSVGGLIAGLSESRGQALLDNASRRMRALTGYDRAVLTYGDQRAESSRGSVGAAATDAELPMFVADIDGSATDVFPRHPNDRALEAALLRAPGPDTIAALRDAGVRACLRLPFEADGVRGEFRCDSRTAREPSFELHAAAELFVQMFAMQLRMDRLRSS